MKYSITLLLALAVCPANGAEIDDGSVLPTGCRMATSADLPQLQISVRDRDVKEASDPRRSEATGDPAAKPGEPEYDSTIPSFRISQDTKLGLKQCLAVGWQVVPVGPGPVSAADFEGGQLPRGIAVIPKEGRSDGMIYLRAPTIDDHITEANEQFRIELTGDGGAPIWGQAEPAVDEHGRFQDINPNAVVYTLHDIERDCARPGAGSDYKLSIKHLGGRYKLVIDQPEGARQCAYIAWRYLDDTVPSDHPDGDFVLQGAAYFSSDAYSWAMGNNSQDFDMPLDNSVESVGAKVRIAWGLGSDQPAIAVLVVPPARKYPD